MLRPNTEQKKLGFMVLFYSLASSLVGIFLPIYYLKIGSGDLVWIIEFLATQFIVLGIVPRFTLRYLSAEFERLILFGFVSYCIYDYFLIYISNPYAIGIAAGLALGTFWPSFNTIQLRISNKSNRATTINTISIFIMTVGSTIGPVIGGIVVSARHGFTYALILSAISYFAAFVSIRKFAFNRVAYKENQPMEDKRKSDYKFRLFGLGYIIQGMSEVTWFVYPIYVLTLTHSYIDLGIIASATALIIAGASVVLGRLADSKQSRFGFIAIGIALNCTWYALLPSVQNEVEFIGASVIVGIAGALSSNIFASLGDQFPREEYPSLLAKVEAYLNSGRIINLGIMFFFMRASNYFGYFETSALILSTSLPVYFLLERRIVAEQTLTIPIAKE
ncbi:MAG: MFS transporter [Nitrososphaerales archaeon]